MSPTTRRIFVLVAMLCSTALLAATVIGQARWIKLAPFPEPSEELYGVAANGKMYVLGGLGARIGMVYEYDPAIDAWTKKKPMPVPTHHQSMVEYRGKIYMFGGFIAPTALGAAGGGGGTWQPIDNTWEYDPTADTWRALAPMSVGRNHAFAGVVRGKIYIIGGRIGHAYISVATNTDVVEEYDPATDTWGGLKAKMPTPRSGGGWATYNDKIYVAGGEVATAQLVGAFRAVEVYDPGANSWTNFLSMPLPRHGVAGAMIGNRFHLVSGMITSAALGGGQDPKLNSYTSAHDAIDLPSQ